MTQPYWPNASDYGEVLQNPAANFRDARICAGQAVTDIHRRPLRYTGNFAAVFHVLGASLRQNWAVKCFTKRVAGLQERYRQIDLHLREQRQRLSFLVGFDYLPNELLVRGERYPVLKMDWVEGLCLDKFLLECFENGTAKGMLPVLCEMWVKLAQRLRDAQVAHGDLQHGNVLLVPDPDTKGALNLRLIDYDGMYVPALSDQTPGEVGHRAYQHRQRLNQGGYGPEIDRFSHLLIYTTLRCLIVGGRELWDRHYDEDRLLLGPQDLAAPDQSPVFRDLWRLDDLAARNLVGHLALAAHGSLEDVPLLEEVLRDRKVVALTRDQEQQVAAWLSPATTQTRMIQPYWPNASDYGEVLQNPAANFRDAQLCAGQAVTDACHRPLRWTGNFAAVFQVRGASLRQNWAVKCFTKRVAGLQERYRQIDLHLREQRQRLPFLVGFDYLPNELLVRGERYPVLKMDWVEGLRLDEFLLDCFENGTAKDTLPVLCDMWLKLAQRLRDAQVAHGDLQHGNVLLVPDPHKQGFLNLRLIDYDGMYVPALANQAPGEVGHPAYQHRQRLDQGGYGPEIDRFSHLLIYTTLRCLIVGGRELWDRHYDEDRLLLGPQDLAAPDQSPVFRDLWRLDDPAARNLVGHLAMAAHGRLEDVPLLEEVLRDRKVVALTRDQEQQVAAWLSPAAAPVLVPDVVPRLRLANAARMVFGMLVALVLRVDRGLRRAVGEENVLLYHFVRVVVSVCAMGALGFAIWMTGSSIWMTGSSISASRQTARARRETLVAIEAAQKAQRLADGAFRTNVRPAAYRRAKELRAEGKAALKEDNFALAQQLLTNAAEAFGQSLADAAAANALGDVQQKWTSGRSAAAVDELQEYARESFQAAEDKVAVAETAAVAENLAEAAASYREALDTLNRAVTEATAARDRADETDALVTQCKSAIAAADKPAAELLLAKLEKLAPQDSRLTDLRQAWGRLPSMNTPPNSPTAATLPSISNSIGMKLVLLPAGEFLMGSLDSDRGADANEKPQHRVQITKPFYLGVYEVTQAQYQKVVGSNPSHFKGESLPVEMVSWDDAVAFCKRLSEVAEERAAGRTYRLPTEAEWEYACRAGSTSKYSFGDSEAELGTYAWYNKNSIKATHPVGAKQANAWGLYDMHGNVWEWCADGYGPYAAGAASDPSGPGLASYRVDRGGSCYGATAICRSATRNWSSPSDRDSLGFRLAAVQSPR
ncbi:MAG: SUMF1/EgtB/PvdO family nonheme iron enzyme [Planctomycetota bacterium]|nr:SUMF1/EgtB/PvdO family nonheme iron enzyme [Planctomycetota bacterium]